MSKTFYSYNGFNSSVNYIGCIAGTYTDYSKNLVTSYLMIDKEDLTVSEKDFLKYVKILGMWGFKIKVEVVGDMLKCIFPNKSYLKDVHFIAMFTLLRVALKCEAYSATYYETNDVVKFMFYFKEKYPKLDYFKCFQLGFYKSVKEGKHCPGHSPFKRISKVVSFKEMRIKFPNISASNDLYFKDFIPEYNPNGDYYKAISNWAKMSTLINTDEKAALKILL